MSLEESNAPDEIKTLRELEVGRFFEHSLTNGSGPRPISA
jgi:hypothetical protein